MAMTRATEQAAPLQSGAAPSAPNVPGLPTVPTVLLADDEPAVLRALRLLIDEERFDVREAGDATEALSGLDCDPDVMLLDLRLGDASGEELLAEVRRRSPDTEVIIMTGYASVDSAVNCMRAGAFDYLEKPFHDRHRVAQTLHRALERRLLRARNRELEGELDRRSTLDRIVAQSGPMRRVVRTVRDLGPNQSNVLIEAESGTGKELIARAIHETSPRRDRPFVPVDCGALPEGIVEAELFGYERGAFTGATRRSNGLFRAAHGGTLFLDEVGELPLLMQSKLLRAIQEREVRPLGSESAVHVDVRIVAATNRDLDAEVREGRFRRDLYYRLRVVPLEIPPLRERPEDIAVLASHFLDRYGDGSRIEGLEPEALEALIEHEWAGNVRELENAIEAAVALSPGPRLRVADLRLGGASRKARDGSGVGVAPNADTAPAPEGIPLSLAAYERACLEEALRRAGGEVRTAARLLGIGRSTFYRKLHHARRG